MMASAERPMRRDHSPPISAGVIAILVSVDTATFVSEPRLVEHRSSLEEE
jgi:hypothetical protein